MPWSYRIWDRQAKGYRSHSSGRRQRHYEKRGFWSRHTRYNQRRKRCHKRDLRVFLPRRTRYSQRRKRCHNQICPEQM